MTAEHGRDAGGLEEAGGLEGILAHARAALDALTATGDRARREQALAHFETYVRLLGEVGLRAPRSAAPAAGTAPSWLKLEFGDGRWTVDYRPLPSSAKVGDLLELGGDGRWLVRAVQKVRPRPASVPEREFFVCTRAA